MKELKKRNRKRTKRLYRFVSLLIVFTLLFNNIPLDIIADYIDLPDFVKLFEMPKAYALKDADQFSGSSQNFQNTSDFIDYCYHYHNTVGFADTHKGDFISIAMTDQNDRTLSTDFLGLGTYDAPFEGSVTFGGGDYALSTHRAFFGYLSDNASVGSLTLTRLSDVGDDESKPLFADHVVNGGGTGSWTITAGGSCSFSGVIGEITDGAHVNLTYTNSTSNSMVFNGTTDLVDAGFICGKMGDNSGLSLSYTGSINCSIISTNGNAGGFIGTMGSGANLTISGAPSSFSPTVTANAYAGGLVGEMDSTATITNRPATISGSVNGTIAAGGLYGKYEYTSAASIDLNNAIYQTSATVSGGNCGGLYGELATNGGFAVTSSNTAVSHTGGSGTCFGGIVGKLTTASLTDTVLLQNLKITTNADFSTYGGVFGLVDSSAYVKVDSVEVNASGDSSSFGGVIGATSAGDGVFVDLGDFKLNSSSITNGFVGGGIVGTFNNGVLRLSGTTNMSSGSPASSNNCGQLVGTNNNVLVYALGTGSDSTATAFSSGWKYLRSGSDTADDLGTWGEVIRTFGSSNAVDAGIIDETYLSSGHYVTLSGAETTIDSEVKFAKTALNIQLNQGSEYDCLKFTSGNANKRTTLLGSGTTLTIEDDIDLSGTGIIGFMRDGGDVSSIGSFAGTIDGTKPTDDKYKITLATGEKYGLDSNGNALTSSALGAGQIYRHQHTGLFSVLSGTVSNLEIDGSIMVRNCVDGMNIGGVASQNGGDVTITNVDAKATIDYNDNGVAGTETAGKNIGGLIGFVGTGGTIIIGGSCTVGKGNSSTPDIKLSGHHGTWGVYGGAIGKVTASSFTIDIGTVFDSTQPVDPTTNPLNKLTVKTNVDVLGITAVEANSDCGGLIGQITKAGSYGSRTVNINNLDYDSCSIANAAITNGGGLLGYSWLNTTANIEGMTVTSATINNRTIINNSIAEGGNANFGAMCYQATGKWIVDNLTVTSLTITGGAADSVGLLVNKAYTEGTANTDGTTNYTGGLYLDVLNSGYTLTSVTLPVTPTKYDEIAAYTAKKEADILTGGAGVVSINMNTNITTPRSTTTNSGNVRIADHTVGNSTTTGTGTYTNKLTDYSTTVNSTARYYYNLDLMSSSDVAQNLMLWSVKKYAHTALADEFSTSFTTNISGTADMTGLSFYPVPLADGVTIGNLTLTLDYSGIYAKTGATMDPGANSTDKNQHYLMHSGLFLNSSAGNTLTISGALSLNGNFLEVDDYKGVLISNTMRGKLTCTSGSILLNGITPKTTGNAAYSTGYLLINHIKRKDAIVAVPELKLYNVRTGTGYTAGTAVAKSLIGDAVGPGLKMDFSKIKLAADSTNKIFSRSTLLESIKTDQNAQLVYNFTWDNDWGDSDSDGNADRNVTYGKELSDSSHSGSVEYADKETKYSSGTGTEKHRWFVNPSNNTELSAAVDFSTYLPYVYQAYTNNTPDSNGNYYREIRVNVESDGLTDGCGSYNDPYMITDGEQLMILADFLKNGNIDRLTKVKLPKTEPTNKAAGNRWCTDKTGTTYHDVYDKYDTSNFKLASGTTKSDWTVSDVQEYLASAYYKVTTAEITLESSFVGLGGTTANTAFRGVIVGSGTSNGEPTVTITNESPNPFIKVSNGCVVKDINIVVANNSIALKQEYNTYSTAYFGYDHSSANVCKFYGGIIGEIMGGDNIIDNSYVDYDYLDGTTSNNSTIKLTGSDSKGGTIVPVGGYVGVVVFGGLIFKNMTVTDTITETVNEVETTSTVLRVNNSHLKVNYTEKSYNLADNSDQEAWAAIYVNPIVGRVINGYAVNETEDIYETAAQAAENGHETPQVVTPGSFTVSEDGKYHDDDKTTRLTLADSNTAAKLHTLKNGTKHYSIANVNKSEGNMLEVTPPENTSSDGIINIPNSQAFFILSLITQSCAGTAQSATEDYKTSLSYGTYSNSIYGMSHIADYSDVGTSAASVDDYTNLASKDTAGNTASNNYAIPYIIKHYTKEDSNNNYPARCVTSTLGYYDINLTGKTANSTTKDANDQVVPLDSYTYELPDSFRGLGSVGNYDIKYPNTGNPEGQNITSLWSDRSLNQYCIKLDVFTGNGCTIDEDVYLNKFQIDNYFNMLHKGMNQSLKDNTQSYEPNSRKNNHGIGMFDSLIMKSTDSKLSDFIVTGSVNTQIFNNSYKTTKNDQIMKDVNNNNMWLSVGGVVGWATNGTCLKFEKIHLNRFSVSGSSHIGGLLGFSGLSSINFKIIISECSANEISVKMTSAQTNESQQKSRNALGTFIGKAYESAVVIYGTSDGVNNTDLTKYSEVTIKGFSFGNADNQYTVASGGLIGFAGHCCQIYDMRVSSSSNTITIGNSKVSFSGGIVGCMQSVTNATNETTCIALFKNVTVENINVAGEFAGGFYGGKWDSAWTPYSITLDNCKVIGKSTSEKNTITATRIGYNPCAGGFVGRGLVKTSAATKQSNILIKDCLVSNYTITAVGENSDSKKGVAGGFVGYCSSNADNSTITCYIHDSSVESCIIGASGNYNFGGGAIGWVNPKNASYSNKMLGYNIKLDNVTSNNNAKMGAWVGYLNSTDNSTSIQFSGMAIYGEGFTKNIGNGKTLSSASFVFADYDGQSYGNEVTAPTDLTGTTVLSHNASDKTFTKTVTQTDTTTSGTEYKTQMKTYGYTAEPTITESTTEDPDTDTLSINESGTPVTVTRRVVESGTEKTYAYEVTLQNNELYSINEDTKTIIRTTIGTSSSHAITYNYTEAPVQTLNVTEPDSWSIDETNGTLTRIENGTRYVYTIAVSGLNKGTTVTMPKYPFVNINPQSKLGASEIISGDAAVLYGSNVPDVTSGGTTLVSYSYTDENNQTQYYPSSTTMAAKIYADIKKGTDNRRYTTFNDDTISSVTVGNTTTNYNILDYMQRTVDDDGDRISTFATERQGIQLQNGVNDFAVVVIANTDENETTNLINRYIQLVTNTESTKNYAAADANGYYNVDIKTCTYSNGSFSINPSQTANTAGIKIEDSKFKLNRTYADSKNTNTFTLIDVQFKDPFDTTEIAYHLYVPVYTVKEMAVDFYAVAKTGAHSVAYPGTNEYESLMNANCNHVDSLDTWMTHYIRYRYEADDINTLLKSGKLKWNYEKTINFQSFTAATEDKRLPDNTYMVLIDPNGNADQAYYAKASNMTSYTYTDANNVSRLSWTVPFSAFKDDSNHSMEIASFNKVIATKIIPTPKNDHTGNYQRLEGLTQQQIADGEYDVYAITTSGGVTTTSYYEFRVNGDGNYDLAVADNTYINEDYYLSIYVPKPSTPNNDLYHYSVITPTTFIADNIDYSTTEKPEVKSAGVTQAHDCTILVSELFKQTITSESVSSMTVTPPNQQITASNRTITVDISAVVEPNNEYGVLYMNSNEFFHSFYINLLRYAENGIETDIKALSVGNITAKYSIDMPIDDEHTGSDCADVDLKDNYLNIQTFPASQSAACVNELRSGDKKFTVYAKIEMTFTEEQLSEEFPERATGESYGVSVKAASNLAYDTATLPYTSVTEQYPIDQHKYYIETVPSATLRYVAKLDDTDLYDEIGLKSKNQTTLGVNGRSTEAAERTNMPVNTEAFYNIQSISNASNATKVKITFALSKKTDAGNPITGISYASISDMRNYLDGTITFKSGTAIETVDLSTAESAVPSVTVLLDATKCNRENGIYDVEILFNAKSGGSFREYANYRVDLTEELYKGDGEDDNIDNTVAQNYLIYTNAKINSAFIDKPKNE